MGTKKNRASRSGDPRVRQQDSPSSTPAPAPTAATPADAWVSPDVGGIEVLALPSGNVARVRRSGPEAFMAQGLIPDPLTATVEKAIRSKKGLRPQQQTDIAKDPKQLGALIEMLDRTLCYAVVEPRVIMPPACTECGELNTSTAMQHTDQDREDYHEYKEGERRPGVLYADRVDMDDKTFIMQFTLGGTRDLERFRREHGSAVASLQPQ